MRFIPAPLMNAFAYDSLKTLYKEALIHGKSIEGFCGTYTDLEIGQFVVSFHKKNGDHDLGKISFSIGFSAKTEWNVRLVSGKYDAVEDPALILIQRNDVEKGWCLQSSVIHDDVLPYFPTSLFSYIPEINIKIACLADEFLCSEKKEDALENSIFPIPHSSDEENGVNKPIDYVRFNAEIKDIRFQESVNISNIVFPRFVILTVQTDFGLLDVIRQYDLLTEQQKSNLNVGNFISVKGLLCADVAVGEYSEGAVFDEVNIISVFSDALKYESYDRLYSLIDKKCIYKIDDEKVGSNKKYAINIFKLIHKYLKEKELELEITFAEVHLEGKNAITKYRDNEKCINLNMFNNEYYNNITMFFKINKFHKIKEISTYEEFEENVKIVSTRNFDEWRNGIKDNSEENDEKVEEQEENFYKKEKECGRLDGDPDSFTGIRINAFGDIWDVLNIDMKGNMKKYLMNSGDGDKFSCIGHKNGIYLDYPDFNNNFFIRFFMIEENENLKLENMFPITEGYPCDKIKINARYTWENGFFGQISGSILGQTIDLFIPLYVDNYDDLKPNKVVQVSIYGLALSMEIGEKKEFEINSGPFYELQLSEFLKENPGKTKDDFKAPTFVLGGSVIRIPSELSCIYTLRTTIREICEVNFDDEILLKILVPIIRSNYDDEVYSYIYIAKEKCKDLHLEPNIDIECCVLFACNI